MKLALSTLLLGALCCPALAAAEGNWTASVDWLAVQGDAQVNEIRTQLTGLSTGSIDFRLDDERSGYHASLAYALGDGWQLRAGYLDLGEVDYHLSFDTAELAAAAKILSEHLPRSGKGPTLGVVYGHPLSQYLTLNASLEAFRWELDNRISLNGQVSRQSDDGIDFLYGLSLNTDYFEMVHLGVGWQQVQLAGESTQLWSLQLSTPL